MTIRYQHIYATYKIKGKLELLRPSNNILCQIILQDENCVGFFYISAFFIPGGKNAHFLTSMRTKCGPKYQKSPQCGPNASFADLFGSTADMINERSLILNNFILLSDRCLQKGKIILSYKMLHIIIPGRIIRSQHC